MYNFLSPHIIIFFFGVCFFQIIFQNKLNVKQNSILNPLVAYLKLHLLSFVTFPSESFQLPKNFCYFYVNSIQFAEIFLVKCLELIGEFQVWLQKAWMKNLWFMSIQSFILFQASIWPPCVGQNELPEGINVWFTKRLEVLS